MKKNKKFKEPVMEPIIGINDTTKKPGSVAELIELLEQFPACGKVTLNGNINIDLNEDDGGINIYPRTAFDESVITDEDKDGGIYATGPIAEESDDVMKAYLTGIGHDNNNFVTAIRETSSDFLVNAPVMIPNSEQLAFEKMCLPVGQSATLNEIRHHNAYIAECLGELHRREIAALLEYNTQCLAHFGVETNKVMCDIVAGTNVYDVDDSRPL